MINACNYGAGGPSFWLCSIVWILTTHAGMWHDYNYVEDVIKICTWCDHLHHVDNISTRFIRFMVSLRNEINRPQDLFQKGHIKVLDQYYHRFINRHWMLIDPPSQPALGTKLISPSGCFAFRRVGVWQRQRFTTMSILVLLVEGKKCTIYSDESENELRCALM